MIPLAVVDVLIVLWLAWLGVQRTRYGPLPVAAVIAWPLALAAGPEQRDRWHHILASRAKRCASDPQPMTLAPVMRHRSPL